jgi:hypothetical protein
MDKRSLVVALILIAGCSGQSTTPTTPSSPKITALTVTGGDLLLIGKTETFTATSDTGAPVSARWGSDAPNIAQTDVAGHVTAVGTGTATIYADADGIRGTKLIRTLPNFEGVWGAEYRVIRCESIRPDLCDGLPLYMELTLAQNREDTSGQFVAWDYDSYYQFKSNDVAGSVAADGTLSFTANANSSISNHKLQMHNVRLELRNGQLAGSFEQVWSWEGDRGLIVPLRAFSELTKAYRISR